MGIDGVGVAIIAFGALLASGRFAQAWHRKVADAYHRYRQQLGRSILLGLEFLVAGDIIRTVAVAPTIDNVIVLGLIVLVRTFLSMAMELELNGRWPWDRARAEEQSRRGG